MQTREGDLALHHHTAYTDKQQRVGKSHCRQHKQRGLLQDHYPKFVVKSKIVVNSENDWERNQTIKVSPFKQS